ncbi:MAG: leucine-rich repeat protein [Bacilli bacterium]|nr:leucine-rich repeat protein [Bacilli bacterium]
MATVYVNDDDMTAIANSIRNKMGIELPLKPSQFAKALDPLIVIKNSLQSFLDKSITFYESQALTTVRRYGFAHNNRIHTIIIPNVTTIADHGVYRCRILKSVTLTNCTTIGDSAFTGCEYLASIELPSITHLGKWVFNENVRLKSLTLSGNTVCTVDDDSFLHDTAIANNHGFIYVPSNLVDTYKAASGWSTYANQIIAIPES